MPDEMDEYTGDNSNGAKQHIGDDSERGEEEQVCLDGTSPVSRSSVTHVAYIVSKFDQVKKDLVKDIGFHGILGLPQIPKVDRKFTLWLLTKLDTESKCIIVNDVCVTDVIDFEVARIMGIPCGSKLVGPLPNNDKKCKMQFIQQCIGSDDCESNSLVAAGRNVVKNYSHPMSDREIGNFKVSFVVWVRGHLLAPTKKHNVGSDGFWGALGDPDTIKSFNWSAYVLDELFSAARDVQSEMKQKKTISSITGCSILLQVEKYLRCLLHGLNITHIAAKMRTILTCTPCGFQHGPAAFPCSACCSSR